MQKTIIAIGGGEIKNKETLGIDEYIASRAKERAGERRACGLFIPTASHDFMPYYNSFHKTYTGEFNIKTDVALSVFKDVNMDKMRSKFEKADFIYVGGGDTVFMIEHWKKSGLLPLIREAYERGVLLCGLSAGAICWFETMYTDSAQESTGETYALFPGLNWLKGIISPHYNQRIVDFDKILCYNNSRAYAIEDNCALEFVDGKLVKSISCGGKAYDITCEDGKLNKKIL
ncbi:MAG: peptidase E [Clostridia bacterium]|nr:peptidase E [Clostridia bacterium]